MGCGELITNKSDTDGEKAGDKEKRKESKEGIDKKVRERSKLRTLTNVRVVKR